MRDVHWLELILLLTLLTLITKPLGIYLTKVLNPQEKTPLDFLFKPLEKVTYRLCGIDTKAEHTWKEYLFGILAFSFISCAITYLLLSFQGSLPLNPEKFGHLSSDLKFNTAVSFMTNTNWQSYAGERTLSYFSQMVALVLQNFVSPAIGLTVAAALVRGIARYTSSTLGNFWVDLVRIVYYLLFPLACLIAIFFISQGVPQNFDPYTQATTLESHEIQTIVQGPIASQEAIKLLGSNGGGYTNVNSAHPYENPTPLCNFFQILVLLSIPAAQTYYFGREVKHQKHGWSLFAVMALVFAMGTFLCHSFESKGNPQVIALGVDPKEGNMEGKEERIGLFDSVLFATATTASSCGAVNSNHDSFTPIGGLIPLMNMQLSEVIWGGVGAGLYSILLFVVLSVFTVGLIIGRTPEYLGKKIESFDIKVAVFAVLPFILTILSFTAWGSISPTSLKALGNKGAHGFTEILYAFTSATANNGSSFAGLATNTPWWNILLAIAMLFGRFLVITPLLALAGSLGKKKSLAMGPGSFPLSGTTFIILLISVILLIGALCFLPSLVMGPFLEQFFMQSFKQF